MQISHDRQDKSIDYVRQSVRRLCCHKKPPHIARKRDKRENIDPARTFQWISPLFFTASEIGRARGKAEILLTKKERCFSQATKLSFSFPRFLSIQTKSAFPQTERSSLQNLRAGQFSSARHFPSKTFYWLISLRSSHKRRRKISK